MNKETQGYGARLEKIAIDLKNFVSAEYPEFSEEYETRINETVIDLLDVEKPKVMVYGIYNSGKSTLINSMLRQEVAEIADRPMTAVITEYDHGDYILVDSPGVDAPIEHERVTDAYLDKCHILLFVISSKGIEDRNVYFRLAELIQKDVPFIIVLNDRGADNVQKKKKVQEENIVIGFAKDFAREFRSNAFETPVSPNRKQQTEAEKREEQIREHEQDLIKLQHKIIENLQKVSKDKNIADKYTVVILNAKRALSSLKKSDIENSRKLFKKSHVEDLEAKITQILSNSQTIVTLFKAPVANIKSIIGEFEAKVSSEFSDSENEDYSLRLQTLTRKKDNIQENMKVFERAEVYSYVDALSNAYFNEEYDELNSVGYDACTGIEKKYKAYMAELISYVKKNFSDEQMFSDLSDFSLYAPDFVLRNKTIDEDSDDEGDFEQHTEYAYKSSSLLDLFKSQRRKEKEKRERLEYEARIANEEAQAKLSEDIRKKQKARSDAEMDLETVTKSIGKIVAESIDNFYDEIVNAVQYNADMDKMRRYELERRQDLIRNIRYELIEIENSVN